MMIPVTAKLALATADSTCPQTASITSKQPQSPSKCHTHRPLLATSRQMYALNHFSTIGSWNVWLQQDFFFPIWEFYEYYVKFKVFKHIYTICTIIKNINKSQLFNWWFVTHYSLTKGSPKLFFPQGPIKLKTAFRKLPHSSAFSYMVSTQLYTPTYSHIHQQTAPLQTKLPPSPSNTIGQSIDVLPANSYIHQQTATSTNTSEPILTPEPPQVHCQTQQQAQCIAESSIW